MNNLPKDFQHPGGFVEEVMNYINETAVCPQPMFALGSALTLTGTIYGRKVQSADGQRTNIFTQIIGVSSSGKDQGLKMVARILDSCEASHLRLGQVTSDSAIEWALKRQKRICLLIDEGGYFFGSMSEAKSKGTPQHAIKPALLELWSSANSRWVGKQRVPKDGKTEIPPLVIDNPHLCLLSTSQPQVLLENINITDLRDGWIARNLFFVSDLRPKPEVKELKPIPNTIRAVVYQYKEEVGGGGEGEEVVTVPMNEEAEKVFAEFNDHVYIKMLEADKTDDETNYLYGKAGENARRIALILAVSRAPDRWRAKIEKRDAEYATKLVGHLIAEIIDKLREYMSENNDEKAKKRILKLVTTAGYKGITRNELTRKTQSMRRSMREEYIEDLIDSRDIIAREFTDGRVTGTMFYLRELEPTKD